MGHLDRQASMDRALRRGAQAFKDGEPKTANPYKPEGGWSMAPFWDIGWRDAEKEARDNLLAAARRLVAHANNHSDVGGDFVEAGHCAGVDGTGRVVWKGSFIERLLDLEGAVGSLKALP